MDAKRSRSKKSGAEDGSIDKPIPKKVYSVLDTDLARDNVENDLPAADLEDR